MRPLNRLQIAWRAAQDIADGMVINLGMGMPVAVADYLRPEADVFIHSENGVIGAGPLAAPEHIDTDLVDAGSRRITLRPGAAIVDSSWSFAAIRGGHIDVAILGAFEVAANGDLANWDMRLPNKGPLVGGAMDLASCARAVWVIMDHVTRTGAPRLLEKCTCPSQPCVASSASIPISPSSTSRRPVWLCARCLRVSAKRICASELARR